MSYSQPSVCLASSGIVQSFAFAPYMCDYEYVVFNVEVEVLRILWAKQVYIYCSLVWPSSTCECNPLRGRPGRED